MASFRRDPIFASEKQVWAFADGIQKPYSLTIHSDKISLDEFQRKNLPAGVFVARIGDSYRFLPRAKVTVAPVAASARMKVSLPEVFYPGDVLRVIEPYAMLTVSGIGEAGLTVQGRTAKVTPAGVANATEAAAFLANYFNNVAYLKDSIRCVASGAKLYVYSKDAYTLVEVTPSGTLGTTVTTLAVDENPIGTVLTIDEVTRELVMAANITNLVPVGANIGTTVDEILGVYDHVVDFTVNKVQEFAVANTGRLWLGALPYWDGDIERQVPGLMARLTYR